MVPHDQGLANYSACSTSHIFPAFRSSVACLMSWNLAWLRQLLDSPPENARLGFLMLPRRPVILKRCATQVIKCSANLQRISFVSPVIHDGSLHPYEQGR